MLFKGLIATALSGSLDGITASRNRGGQYFRKRATPTNPNSTNQQEVRAAMGALSSGWRLLTQDQRDNWTSYADQTPVEIQGETRFLTGFQQYIKGNTPREYFEVDRIDDGPATAGLPIFTTPTLAITAATKELIVNFEDTDAWVDQDGGFMYVTASNGLSQSINFFKSGFKKIDLIEGSSTVPPTSPTALVGLQNWDEGDKVFVRINIGDEEGRIGQAVIVAVTVEA